MGEPPGAQADLESAPSINTEQSGSKGAKAAGEREQRRWRQKEAPPAYTGYLGENWIWESGSECTEGAKLPGTAEVSGLLLSDPATVLESASSFLLLQTNEKP